MILTVAEFSSFVPGAEVANPEAAILQAQAAVEGPMGANRPLEKQSFTEILRVSSVRLQSLYLSYGPIDLTVTPTIQIRSGNIQTRYRRAIALSDWQTLAADDYQLDSTGKLSLNVGGSSSFIPAWGQPASRMATEVQATYTAGLDFTATTTEIKTLKYAFAQVVSYQQSQSYSSGIEEIQENDIYRIRYQSPNAGNPIGPGVIPPGLLAPFKKYQPRSGF